MSDTNMPVTEAVVGDERDVQAYEFAFHILPTVPEGEVQAIFNRIKATITTHGGTITNEELPARFDLAYEITKFLEGRNRRFGSAYFGWVRFSATADRVAPITEAVEGTKELLRHLVIRLTRPEEANPFFFHPAIADRVVETIIVEAPEEESAEGVVTEEEVVLIKDGEAEEETL